MTRWEQSATPAKSSINMGSVGYPGQPCHLCAPPEPAMHLPKSSSMFLPLVCPRILQHTSAPPPEPSKISLFFPNLFLTTSSHLLTSTNYNFIGKHSLSEIALPISFHQFSNVICHSNILVLSIHSFLLFNSATVLFTPAKDFETVSLNHAIQNKVVTYCAHTTRQHAIKQKALRMALDKVNPGNQPEPHLKLCKANKPWNSLVSWE
ncbi:hypothetical protein KIL84_008962 [Mauremys mutica]|uniref:Uncharacterized protein n=1 Tax=Mauremys mutica TaxID=74926 RepID=A0A9D3XIC9_9SAUR|nr:hypothetical protein KIL84_008962 [Mauremys mutica]